MHIISFYECFTSWLQLAAFYQFTSFWRILAGELGEKEGIFMPFIELYKNYMGGAGIYVLRYFAKFVFLLNDRKRTVAHVLFVKFWECLSNVAGFILRCRACSLVYILKCWIDRAVKRATSLAFSHLFSVFFYLFLFFSVPASSTIHRRS